MNLLRVFISVLAISFICGCSNDQTVYAYMVVKNMSEEKKVNKWRPVLRIGYRVGENKVMSEVAGLLDEYQNCKISNRNNWECQYEDGTGLNKFGFKKGRYWQAPMQDENAKYVSRWEYNVIRCKWHQIEKGKLKGLASCFRTYI